MLPSMVAPIIGPRSTPSRIVMRPGTRVKSARAWLNSMLLFWLPIAARSTPRLSSAPSPRMAKSLTLMMPSCGEPSCVGGSMPIHILPPTMRWIDVGETEQRAGVVGLEIEHRLAVVDAGAHVADQRRVAADLGVQREGADPAAAARHPHIEAADRLAVMAGHHAELDVEIEIGMARLDLRIGRAGHRRS